MRVGLKKGGGQCRKSGDLEGCSLPVAGCELIFGLVRSFGEFVIKRTRMMQQGGRKESSPREHPSRALSASTNRGGGAWSWYIANKCRHN